MKKLLKTWLAALMCLGAATATAQPLPEFSTKDSPSWYNVKFTTGGAILSAENSGVLQTAAQQIGAWVDWQLIGNQDEFIMLARNGKYVGWNGSRFTGETSEASAVKLRLSSVDSENWEIGRVGATQYLNQFAGTGPGRELGEWDSKDNNNKLTFVASAGLDPEPVEFPENAALAGGGLPILSTDAQSYYYYIRFARGNNNIKGVPAGSVVTTTVPADDAADLWKVVGTDYDHVQIVNICGQYMTYDSAAGRIKASETPSASGFKIIDSPERPGSFEIEVLGLPDDATQRYFNQFGGASAGVQIGLWVHDQNNPLSFVTLLDNREYAEARAAQEEADRLEQEIYNQEHSLYLGITDGVRPSFNEYSFTASTTYQPEQPATLWYTRPGTSAGHVQRWMHMGLPIGNGEFGATVLGGIHAEEVSFNEKTLWTGRSKDDGDYGCYQSFGTVFIESLDGEGLAGGVTDYWRNLDLVEGVANVHFTNSEGVNFDRSFLSSYPDKVIAMRLAADKAGAINVRLQLMPGMDKKQIVEYTDGAAVVKGRLETVRFAGELRVIPAGEGASLLTDANGITVSGADEVLVLLAGATDFHATNLDFHTGESLNELADRVKGRIDAAAAKGWQSILADHVADHSELFNRVNLQFATAVNERPTDDLIRLYKTGKNSSRDTRKAQSLMLEQLYFAYGRYLLIGSSRGVDSPANLQGIWSGYDVYQPWNDSQIATWNADIHNNINLQMCYWPAEPTNLSELHMPMLNYLINMATVHPRWRQYAQEKAGQTKGWTFFTESNIFGGTGSFMQNYTIANAWCATHLWQHYKYTLDKEFLARAFPTMWSAAQFWIERLVKAADGTWECPNEYSPEHGPSQNATAHSQQLVWELFSNCLDAIEVLGSEADVDEAELAMLRDRFENLDRGLAIEQYTGSWGANCNGVKSGTSILREWKYSDYTAGANGHRHLSHLMCLYPLSQVEAGTPEFDAAVSSLRLRGDGATGWSMGWKINAWARALDGDHARLILRNALAPAAEDMNGYGGSGVYNNLFDSHSPFQIDGNFGACSGIAEMLMQSHAGYVHLLPALPSYWDAGSISGLKAQGDFTVDVEWAEGKVAAATVTSNRGGTLGLRNSDVNHLRVSVDGQAIEPKVSAKGVMEIPTEKGSKVTLTYDAEYSNPNSEMDAIESVEVAPAATMTVSAAAGVVSVSGPVASVSVFDLTGRKLASSASGSVKVPAAAGSVVVVRAIAADGSAVSAKVII